MRILEVGLLAVAVFHILNGLRLLFVDLGVGLEAQDKSFYASLILTGVIVVASVPTFLGGSSLMAQHTPPSTAAGVAGCASADLGVPHRRARVPLHPAALREPRRNDVPCSQARMEQLTYFSLMILFLVTATFHGVNGVYNALVNQGLSGTRKTAVKAILGLASVLLIVQGVPRVAGHDNPR